MRLVIAVLVLAQFHVEENLSETFRESNIEEIFGKIWPQYKLEFYKL